ncbi:hypothetical protein TNCV_1823071 [Trichonephila clavipes]|nr:hypothetical protein TNCV_1823071 [Trichonephila clavipes]
MIPLILIESSGSVLSSNSLSNGEHNGISKPLGSTGSLVTKETDSWPVYQKFELRTTVDLSCRGGRCTLKMPRLKRSPVGVLWKLGERGASSGVLVT